jgi:hypothetical protein
VLIVFRVVPSGILFRGIPVFITSLLCPRTVSVGMTLLLLIYCSSAVPPAATPLIKNSALRNVKSALSVFRTEDGDISIFRNDDKFLPYYKSSYPR